MSTWLAISLSLLLLAANAFFVGAEFALISARRSVIEPKADEGGMLARVTLRAMENVSLMMAGAQVGITLCTLGLGALAEPALAHAVEVPLEAVGAPQALVHPIAFMLALLVVASLHVVLGEMVPKNIALARPDRSALVLAPPLRIVVTLLYPAIALLNWIANAVLRLMGIKPRNEVASAFTRDEVAGLVEESRREGFLDSHESSLLEGALGFAERTAKSVLIPLETIETVPVTVTPAEVEAVAARTGFSRFPVSREGRLVGYLHLKDALEFKDRHRNRPIAESWVRPLPTVLESELLRSVLETMQGSGAHLAQVAGPEGQTTGVVALEDVLEELIGEIRDATRRQTA
ncbi:MAG: hemolysin family protein [Solirubrobacterales bacterium]